MTKEKAIDKIRKLLRLSRDSAATEAEAATALGMAQRLMLEHDIQEVEEQRVPDAIRGEWMNVNKREVWEANVASAVAVLYNCRNVLRKASGEHQFVGKPENIEACGETFLWVCAQVEVLYKEALRAYSGSLGKSGRADLRRSFKYACSLRVYQRAKEIVAKARNDIPAHMALVVIDQSLAAADELIAGVRKTKSVRHRAGIGTHAGLEAGNRVRLQGSIHNNEEK